MDTQAQNTHTEPERLKFRRQFLLATKPYAPNNFWKQIELSKGWWLSVHHDLDVCIRQNDGSMLVVLGIVLDPHHPSKSQEAVVDFLMSEFDSQELLLKACTRLAGRWAILSINSEGRRIFTDPCGFRSIYYSKCESNVCCASQPELLRTTLSLQQNKDEKLLEFLDSRMLATSEFAWVGTKTIYENCFHLLPNHFLKLDTGVQVRYYPRKPLVFSETESRVERACQILQGTLEALSNRYELALPLTAGLDSRVLFAASKPYKNSIHYYVHQQFDMSERHQDVVVPKFIAAHTGITFTVTKPKAEIPEAFVQQLIENVTGARHLPKTHNIYELLQSDDKRININGNGSEICRNYLDKYCRKDIENISIQELGNSLLGRGIMPSFVLEELQQWRKGLGVLISGGFNQLDLLYWEQRLGNWGAQFPSEQDIAVEEISPFNNRELLEILITAPRSQRAAPKFNLYQKLIGRMWPELLNFPINPQFYTRYGKFKQRLRKALPKKAEKRLRKFMNS